MSRLLLPILAGLLLGATAPAHAQVLTAAKDDPAERPQDPGRDIQSIASTFDGAGTWTVSVRFYGVPAAETSALLRVHLAERLQDGTCAMPANQPALMAAYTDPADKGGKGMVDGESVNLVKTVDEDQRGFTLTFADSRLAPRAACAITRTTLSRKEPFDSVPTFEFPGAPAEPGPDPVDPGQSGQPGVDHVAPSARMAILRDAKAARKGIVRVSVLAASENMLARATLYGPRRRAIARLGKPLAPGQELRLSLRLDAKAMKRLRWRGRLPVEVVTMLVDDAGNQARVRGSAVLRLERR